MGSSVTVVIVSYHSAEVISAALSSVVADPFVAKVIVVDNAAGDGTATRIAREFPSVEVIDSGGNIGYGRGCNLGLSKVQTPYALLLNPDAYLKPGALALLVEQMQADSTAFITAPQLFDADDKPYATIKRSVFTREIVRTRFVLPEGACCAEFISGAVWLLSMEGFKGQEFFDPRMFLYYEDDDLCLKARQLGGACVLVPQAHAVHLLGKSSDKSEKSEYFRHWHMAWSRLYMQEKYHDATQVKKVAKEVICKAQCKQVWYRLLGKKTKAARYQGRIEGMKAYLNSVPATPEAPWQPAAPSSPNAQG